MICERCGGDSGPYRMHPDPMVCVAVLTTWCENAEAAGVGYSQQTVDALTKERDRLAAELAEFKAWHDKRVNWYDAVLKAEREAHARTRAVSDHRRNQVDEEQARASRAEGILRELRAWLDRTTTTLYVSEIRVKLTDLEATHADRR